MAAPTTKGSQAFPDSDPVGASLGTADHRHAVVARDLVRDLLAPGAFVADRDGLPRATLDALGNAGLMGMSAPASYGGTADGTPASVAREVGELIAGGCGTTWFCWVQHQNPTRNLATAAPSDLAPHVDELRDALLPGLASGDLVSAIAFAHVRRPGPPQLTARRDGPGWRLSGSLDWVTTWDIADVVMVVAAAEEPYDDRFVLGFLDTAPQPGLEPGPVLELLSMGGTHTRPVRLDEVWLSDHRVVAVDERADYLGRDLAKTVNASPPAFGITRAAVAELAATGTARSDSVMRDLADALAEECRDVRSRAYDLVDGIAPGGNEARLALRAHSLDLAVRSTQALVTAQAGAAMAASRPTGRWAREALFYLVQAQTAATREAQLLRLARASGIA
ncbi:MAG: acyl-CoA dehydrogenase family protein [Candidatus Nanopelagicales bacterium]